MIIHDKLRLRLDDFSDFLKGAQQQINDGSTQLASNMVMMLTPFLDLITGVSLLMQIDLRHQSQVFQDMDGTIDGHQIDR
jgi:hypothetical protein